MVLDIVVGKEPDGQCRLFPTRCCPQSPRSRGGDALRPSLCTTREWMARSSMRSARRGSTAGLLAHRAARTQGKFFSSFNRKRRKSRIPSLPALPSSPGAQQPPSGFHSTRVQRNRGQPGRLSFSAESCGAHRAERRSLTTHVPPGDGNHAAAICGRASRRAAQIRIKKGERRDHSTA